MCIFKCQNLEHDSECTGYDAELRTHLHDIHPDANAFGAIAHPAAVLLDEFE